MSQVILKLFFKNKKGKKKKIIIHTMLTRFLLMEFLAFGRFIPTTTIPENRDAIY